MSNSKQFNHNIEKAKRQRAFEREQKEIAKDKYIDWILSECTAPYDEIGWLITTIKESDNAHLIDEVLKEFK